MRKWLTTHGPEEEEWRGQYVLRVSHCLEFLCEEISLFQYKVSGYMVDCRYPSLTDTMCQCHHNLIAEEKCISVFLISIALLDLLR